MLPTLKYTRLQMSVISMIPRRGFWPRPNPLTNTAFSCPIFSPSHGKRGFLCLSPAPGPSIGQREILIFPDLLFQRGDGPLKLGRPHFALRQRKGRVLSPAPDDGRRAYRRRGDAGALAPAHALVKQRKITAEGGDPQVLLPATYPEGVPSEDEYPKGLALLFILLSLVLSIFMVAVDQARRWISFPPLPPTRR